MNALPNPLHPAVVHFPIVLILLGAAVALVAAFWRKGYIPVFAAILLSLGALGSWVAMETGESDGGIVENSTPAAEQLIEAHEEWAERTLVIASIAAVIAVASAGLFKFPRIARGIGVA
ncbi:MAG TPA: DUF2231 domain-containing protein, partial [Candidatus Paceibacterota bacterium]|nr:DUF2231 domain-containing protein [Candidatus Paceibacterota bacterium]